MKKRRDKRHSPFRGIGRRAETLAARALLGAASFLPAAWIGPISRIGGGAVGRRLPARRAILEENLRRSLGETSPGRIAALVKAVHQNALLMLFECARLGRVSLGDLRPTVECDAETAALLKRIAGGGRGAILMTAHIGNWEWVAAWVGDALGRPFGIVYKPLHNPDADAMLLARRKRLGLIPYSTRSQSQRELLGFLRQGGIVGILPDQDAGRRGEFIPFFGKEASTTTAFAKLAARLDLEAVFIVSERIAPGRFRLRAEPLERPPAGADRDEAARRIMLDYHRKLEEAIRRSPEQYFWWHRRWRTQPKRKNPARRP